MFVIRNYLGSREILYKGQNYFIARDGVIETEDIGLVDAAKLLPGFSMIMRSDAPNSTESITVVGIKPVEDIVKKEVIVDAKVVTTTIPKSSPISVPVNFDDMNLPELKKYATDNGIEVKGKSRSQVIELLKGLT